ncbi:NADP-dependent malic enzyme [Inhella sp.]|uniref:NADP-dependent malic enzyme n=1 Tax=Inhella sp. TaxID=1921806 RepID=UPI0035B2A467
MNEHTPPSSEAALREAALEYHRLPTRGKISVAPTKPLANQRDLSLAYSPGVAYPCLDIEKDPRLAAEYTARGNLVGVVTNGTAVLGLGDIGPLAAKPVMEGKGCLFKKFAGIDVFDIELNEKDPDKLVEHIAALEPTLGGINLEDIKAPECFYVEKKLKERLSIPVFHDDQHGTAIISGAALLNALELVGKQLGDIKLVCSGAGAAAIACLDVMVGLGVNRNHIYVLDSKGVIQSQREDALAGKLDESKQRYCQITAARTLADAMVGADVFLGCSTAGVLKPEMVGTMAERPIILALANPEPEIRPELAKQARPDCIVATGRSDYPNQVNNVLCFPYIFRGALDCGATTITEAMKLACVREIAALAKAEISDEVASAYAGQDLAFGPEYIIPKPFDARLILRIAPAVAQAAMDSGVATRPIADMDAYRQSLQRFVYQTGLVMRPVFASAKRAQARVIYAEGEDERALRAAQVVRDEGLAQLTLIGRPAVIEARITRAGLRLKAGLDFELVNPEDDPRYRDCWEAYQRRMGREGITPSMAKAALRRSHTLIGSMLVQRGDADALLCGLVGRYDHHLEHVRDVIGLRPGAHCFAALNALLLENRTLFIADTFVNEEPSSEDLAEIGAMAVDELKRFGIPPRVAFVSHSMFGSSTRPSARRMREAAERFKRLRPGIPCDGEMHGDAALSEEIRRNFLPETTLDGEANLLLLPNLDAANILFNVLKMTGGQGVTVGPVLLGAAKPVHILTPSATVRRVVNMTALAGAEAR